MSVIVILNLTSHYKSYSLCTTTLSAMSTTGYDGAPVTKLDCKEAEQLMMTSAKQLEGPPQQGKSSSGGGSPVQHNGYNDAWHAP